jgi:hypothetical protein
MDYGTMHSGGQLPIFQKLLLHDGPFSDFGCYLLEHMVFWHRSLGSKTTRFVVILTSSCEEKL